MNDLPTDEYLSKKYPTRGSFVVDGKTVPIPSIYRGKALTAVFPVSYEKAAAMIHSKNLKPARLSFSKALLSVTAFDFSESPVGPYTELVFAVPVFCKSKINLPLAPLLLSKYYRNFGFHVLDIFQSTTIAVKHGNLLTGYPHNSHLIDVEFVGSDYGVNVKVFNRDGIILSIKTSKPHTGKQVENSHNTFFEKDESFFKIGMDVIGHEQKINNCFIDFYRHDLSLPTAGLNISRKSIRTSYYPNVIEINPVTLEIL